jgi:hypothetical protein
MAKHTVEHNDHSTKIKVKDHVAVDYHWDEGDTTIEYCKIDQLLEVTDDLGGVRFWMIPLWCWKQQGQLSHHPIRRTEVVQGNVEGRGVPVLCSDVIEQVLLVHSCNRGDASSPLGVCKIEQVCHEHKSTSCIICSDQSPKITIDVCSKDNNNFEVVDPAFGFLERFVLNDQ